MPKRRDYRAFTVTTPKGHFRELITPVSVRLGTTVAQAMNLPQSPENVQAIWDTGATTTSISGRLAKKLSLNPVSKAKVRGVNVTKQANLHIVDILLPHGVVILNVHVVEADNLGAFDVLVGMNLISLGDFTISNADGRACFSFRYPPGLIHLNYIREIEKIKRRRQRRKQKKLQ